MWRILIIDDNITFITAFEQFIKEVCSPQTVCVHHATSGLTGFALFEKGNYDFIFIDIEMPEVNGIEITRLIDLHHPRKKAVIVAVSFHSEIVYVEKMLSAGARHYLCKDSITPVTLEQILWPQGKPKD